MFRPHNELNKAAPVGRALGTGEIVDCGTAQDAKSVDSVRVYAVEGVDSNVAVATKDRDWRGIYIAEGTPRSAWPKQLESVP